VDDAAGPGWQPALQTGAPVLKDKTIVAVGPNDEKKAAELDGTFYLDERTIYVRREREEREEHPVPIAYQIYVEDGDYVTPGQQLTDGAKDPQDILITRGRDEVQRYIIDQVQNVYRSQGVNTNDKHIEVICRQMLRKVSIVSPGDTDFLQDERIDRFEFNTINEDILAQGGEPATAMPQMLGITKASLETDSFLSAASFQETTRVLTEAAINGKVDNLRGLKENVIIGKLIPAGSGFGAGERRKAAMSRLDEITLETMSEGRGAVATVEAEEATDEDFAELLSSGLIPGGLPTEVEGFSIEAANEDGWVPVTEAEEEE